MSSSDHAEALREDPDIWQLYHIVASWLVNPSPRNEAMGALHRLRDKLAVQPPQPEPAPPADAAVEALPRLEGVAGFWTAEDLVRLALILGGAKMTLGQLLDEMRAAALARREETP